MAFVHTLNELRKIRLQKEDSENIFGKKIKNEEN
jgi:hypothetical protein